VSGRLGWRHTAASATGVSHRRLGLPCQDAGECLTLHPPGRAPVLVAAVADGAGSARFADVGARLACARAVDEIAAHLAGGGSVKELTRAVMERIVAGVGAELAARAEDLATSPRQLACTLLLAVVGETAAVFAQVGDGAMVVVDPCRPDAYCWVFWPEQGEYANTTSFVTDEQAPARLAHACVEHAIHEVALFSDGLQRLALHLASQTAHDPFFRPLFRALRATAGGYQPGLATALGAFLTSPRVSERTDDDTTLILATRLPPEGAAP
jgi:hypothetical protein